MLPAYEEGCFRRVTVIPQETSCSGRDSSSAVRRASSARKSATPEPVSVLSTTRSRRVLTVSPMFGDVDEMALFSRMAAPKSSPRVD